MAAKEAFATFDSDHNGQLDHKEMVQLLHALMPEQSKRQVRHRPLEVGEEPQKQWRSPLFIHHGIP